MLLLPTLADVFGSITGLYTVGIISLLTLLALRPVVFSGLNLACPPFLRLWEFDMLIRLKRRATGWAMRRILYRNIFKQGSSLSTYTRANIICIIVHLSINIACVFINISKSEEVFSRAGKLAIANAILLYLGPCLDFSASILHIRLRAQRQLHASTGYVVATLSILHAAGAFSKRGWAAIDQTRDLLAALALLGICIFMLPMSAIYTFLPYELVLFTHNAVALSLGYVIWCHVPTEQQLVRTTLCMIAGIFLLLVIVRAIVIAFKNHFWFQAIVIEHYGLSRYVRIKVNLRRPLHVEPGQYIKIWTPTSLSSVLQSHPFTIANCSSEAESELRIIVDVKKGFTKSLMELTDRCLTSNIAIFAGPYGSRVHVENYETVLLVATGLGFVALSPYLQWLVRAAHDNKIRISPVHLVWQVSSWEQLLAAGDLLIQNIEIEDNKNDDRTFIKTSIYYEEYNLPPSWAEKTINLLKETTKKWSRVNFHENLMPLTDLLSAEAVIEEAGQDTNKPTLIAASVSGDVRDDLIQFATKNTASIDLVFTDYQPQDHGHPIEDGSVNRTKCSYKGQQATVAVDSNDNAHHMEVGKSD